MTYTPSQAVARAGTQAASRVAIWHLRCLGFLVWCYFGGPTSHGYGDATTTFWHTTRRHTGTPPAGALCWWTGGEHGHGHGAVSAGGGWCYSTDFGPTGYVGDGRVRRIPIASISRYDRLLTYRGWSQDINGVTVLRLATSSARAVSLSMVQAAARSAGRYVRGSAQSVNIVRGALTAEGLLRTNAASGIWDKATTAGYAGWQRRLRYSGADANGIPGRVSLTELGARHRFTVTP